MKPVSNVSPSHRADGYLSAKSAPEQIRNIETLLHSLEKLLRSCGAGSLVSHLQSIRNSLEKGKRTQPKLPFLSLFSKGEESLRKVQEMIAAMGSDELAPGDFLRIQLELGQAQHRIEMGSLFIGKALDAVRLLFNTQI